MRVYRRAAQLALMGLLLIALPRFTATLSATSCNQGYTVDGSSGDCASQAAWTEWFCGLGYPSSCVNFCSCYYGWLSACSPASMTCDAYAPQCSETVCVYAEDCCHGDCLEGHCESPY